MLAEALTVLATGAGSAVGKAAGTDLWTSVRERVAAIFGRKGAREGEDALARLDRTSGEVASAREDDVERVRAQAGVVWQTRFADLLEDLDDAERDEVARLLRALVDEAEQASGGVSAGDRGLAVGGDLNISVGGSGSVGAGTIQGDVNIGNPPSAGSEQG